jgi:3,4-dihydroxy 2-butanone 4-phosphate synthase / GTP cyclohydrolase II
VSVAFVHGDIGRGEDMLVSMPVECLIGDVFGSLRLTYRIRLDAATAAITREHRGVALYLRAEEGSRFGLRQELHNLCPDDPGGR